MLLLRLRDMSLLVMFDSFSLNFASGRSFVTTTATSSLETVTKLWVWGSVLSSQLAALDILRKVKGCFWHKRFTSFNGPLLVLERFFLSGLW